MRNFLGSIVLLSLIGCSTSGHLSVRNYEALPSASTMPTVTIKLDPDLSYGWGPWEPDLKD